MKIKKKPTHELCFIWQFFFLVNPLTTLISSTKSRAEAKRQPKRNEAN